MKQEQRQQILRVLAGSIRKVLENERIEFEKLQEIRLRIRQPFIIFYGGKERILSDAGGQVHIVTKEELKETLDYISNYSLYAYEQEMSQGFITIEGGHRVGMAGKAVLEENRVKNLRYISAVNIRVSHEVPGCADGIFPYITGNSQLYHTLIISPPGCGKTTLLRDIIRQVSDGNERIRGYAVGVVDERSEIGGCYMGIPQNQLGMRTDVLDCCPKAEGMLMLIRSMSPRVLAVDEIGSVKDAGAIEYAMHCGCKMLATAHGASMEEMQRKPVFDEMIKAQRFERYIVLGNKDRVGEIVGIYDERGNQMW